MQSLSPCSCKILCLLFALVFFFICQNKPRGWFQWRGINCMVGALLEFWHITLGEDWCSYQEKVIVYDIYQHFQNHPVFKKKLIDDVQQSMTNEMFHLFYFLSFLNKLSSSHSQVVINFLENIHWCFKKFHSIFS